MASPQKEQGYTAIANELYDAIIRWHFSSYEYRVLIFLIRKTYGWNKKTDWISLSQFTKGTLIKDTHICRTIKLLLEQNVITKGGNPDHPIYGIQKDYEKWVKLPKGVRSHHALLPKGVMKKGVIESVKGGNPVCKRGEIQKTLYTKDTITKPTRLVEEISKWVKDTTTTINSPIGWTKSLITTYGESKVAKMFDRMNRESNPSPALMAKMLKDG